eukprot:10918114-Alexandrium_andersonii.AAC.1
MNSSLQGIGRGLALRSSPLLAPWRLEFVPRLVVGRSAHFRRVRKFVVLAHLPELERAYDDELRE